jgi:2-amino-4-hydroxy-6-hydroxymethyldihydropteridine diphosphokinase
MLKLKLNEPEMIYRYYLSLGSNISPRMFYMKSAITELEKMGTIVRKSAIYKSEPWGKTEQPPFLNAIIFFHTSSPPFELLHYIKKIEKASGRNNSMRWGPREIDIDIILCENIMIQHKDLIIPHENFQKRKFVLIPMMDLDKNYRIEGTVNTIETVYNSCPDPSYVKQLKCDW